MNIVTHHRIDLVNDFNKKHFDIVSSIVDRYTSNINTRFNYLDFIKKIDTEINEFALYMIKTLIKAVEESFFNNKNRTKRYHSKGLKKRTIVTLYGPLSFRRRFYKDNDTGEHFAYVDRCFRFEKYDRFDSFVKAFLTEAVCEMSMAAAGRKVSAILGERTKNPENKINISRQVVRSFINRLQLKDDEINRKEITPETLWVMLDEKYIPLQQEEKKDAVIYHGVVFEDLKLMKGHKSRNQLVNKHVFAQNSPQKLNNDILDYIYNAYDVDSIKDIYVLGDGANWIKSSVHNYSFDGCKSHYALDKYHFKAALRLIFLNEEKENEALKHILESDKKSFNNMVFKALEERQDRSVIIATKRDYILNNWNAIILSYKRNLKCCMEGQISHNIASLLASRPGGYSNKTLTKLLGLRINYLNGRDMKKAIFNGELIHGKKRAKAALDFSLFDKLHPKPTHQLGRPGVVNFLARE